MHLRNHCFKVLFSLSLLFCTKFAFSQSATDFIGDWKITNVELSTSAGHEEKQMLEIVTPIFLKSVFHFKPNNSFSFNRPNKDLSIKDGVWQFDMKKQYLKVIERTPKRTPGQLMGTAVTAADGGYLFQIEETPVIVTVTRTN